MFVCAQRHLECDETLLTLMNLKWTEYGKLKMAFQVEILNMASSSHCKASRQRNSGNEITSVEGVWQQQTCLKFAVDFDQFLL